MAWLISEEDGHNSPKRQNIFMDGYGVDDVPWHPSACRGRGFVALLMTVAQPTERY